MPSTSASTETTHNGRARTTAASSPIPRNSRAWADAGARASSAAIASIRERSAAGASAMAVDDPRAVQIVGRELAADAVAREDADAKAPHLARHVSEHNVTVVELDAKHRVGQRLDHLALEFNLVLLCHCHLSNPGQRFDIARPTLCVCHTQTTSAHPPAAAPPVPLTAGACGAGGGAGAAVASPGALAGG